MINLSELPQASLDFMNQDHEYAAGLVNDIEKQYELGDVNEVERILVLLQKHCIEHFSHEEKEMIKHSFPPYSVHKQEHDRALMDLDMIIKQLNNHRDLSKVSGHFRHEFSAWFTRHLATMDRMTAQFITKNMQANT